MATAKAKETPGWRRYRDACGAAQGLDLVGERWTLLVVRELLLGPKRFTDLREGLPGISTNILADRLETLEMSGVARRRRPRPARRARASARPEPLHRPTGGPARHQHEHPRRPARDARDVGGGA